MKRPRVLHLINKLGAGSGPFDRSLLLNNEDFEIIICFYYDSQQDLASLTLKTDRELIGLGATNRVDFKSWARLYRVIKDKKIDIIHTYHHLMGILGRIIGKFASTPIVVHNIGNTYNKFSLLARLINNLTFMFIDSVICVSKSVEESFTLWENMLLNGKKVVIYNGTNISEIDNCAIGLEKKREELNIKQDDFVIGNIARLIPQKDHKTLIRAFSSVLKNEPKAKLIIAGGGKLEKALKRLVKDLGIENHVIFAGLIERNEVYKILHILDLFVLSSLWEGFCVALLQAMAARKPVVLTDIPQFREAFGDDVCGKLVPTEDPEALAKAILELKNNPKRAKEMGEAGRKRVTENFSLQKT
ncbi:glycosyltransferase, partial [bacterium]|nr:glycosyltransferase [bacterium]